MLSAVEKVPGFSDAEKEAIRGFAKTIQALDLLLVINTRDVNGAPIDVNRPLNELNDNPPKIEPKAVVLPHIATLLDEAEGHLQRGGGAFSFPLSSGFEGFGTPAQFRRFNRALRARVDTYMGAYPQALTALQGSFLSARRRSASACITPTPPARARRPTRWWRPLSARTPPSSRTPSTALMAASTAV